MVDVHVLRAADQDSVLLRVREPLPVWVVPELAALVGDVCDVKERRRRRLPLGSKPAERAAGLVLALLHCLQHRVLVVAGNGVEH